MEDIWLDGYTRRDVAGRSGGTYTDSTPWKICLHTIEGSVSSALSAYDSGTGCPHLTVSLRRQVWLQHIPLNRSAYALRNARGGTETNHDNVIQVEIEGFANASHGWPVEEYMRLAYNVIDPIMEHVSVEKKFAATTGVAGYGLDGAVRMSAAEWDAFGGVLGHANVPENTHWDPGALNMSLLAALLERDESMGYFEKYSDPEVGEEYIASKKRDGKIIFRRFSSPRGDGKQMAGLSYVLKEWVRKGYVQEVKP